MKAIKVGVFYLFISGVSLLSSPFVSAIVGAAAYRILGKPVASLPRLIVPGQIIVVTGVTLFFVLLFLKKRASANKRRLVSIWLAIVLPYVLVYYVMNNWLAFDLTHTEPWPPILCNNTGGTYSNTGCVCPADHTWDIRSGCVEDYR